MVVKHLELFSGIGGFRYALEMLCKDFGFSLENTGFSEIDCSATATYKAVFNTENELEIGDIVAFMGDKGNVSRLPEFNLLTGGFPCQAFSMMGQQKGFKDLRGNVFFQIIDLISEKQPPFILLENVKNLLTHNRGQTFKTITASLKNAGYQNIYHDVFNSSDFSLAQNRSRVYIFASKTKLPASFVFHSKSVIETFRRIDKAMSILKQKTTLDVLEKNVDKKYYLSEVIKPTILADGSKNFRSKSDINQLIARPLTATMAKMHRACQDNYFSDDFIQNKNPAEYDVSAFSKEELAKKNIRRITPREAFKLQGFNDLFFEKAKKCGVSDSQLYKQAGNAVSVNTVYAILYYLLVEKKILGGC
jgi:DNA (cytosine-5)-methyltransferase 1